MSQQNLASITNAAGATSNQLKGALLQLIHAHSKGKKIPLSVHDATLHLPLPRSFSTNRSNPTLVPRYQQGVCVCAYPPTLCVIGSAQSKSGSMAGEILGSNGTTWAIQGQPRRGQGRIGTFHSLCCDLLHGMRPDTNPTPAVEGSNSEVLRKVIATHSGEFITGDFGVEQGVGENSRINKIRGLNDV